MQSPIVSTWSLQSACTSSASKNTDPEKAKKQAAMANTFRLLARRASRGGRTTASERWTTTETLVGRRSPHIALPEGRPVSPLAALGGCLLFSA